MSYDYPNVFLPTEGKDFPQYGAKEVHGGIIMGGDKLSHERKASGIGQASSMSYISDSWSSIPSSPVSLGYYSDVKNPQTSAVSYLSENCLSIPPSPVSNIGYYPDFGDPEPKPTTSDPYENSRPSNPRSSQQFYSSDGYFQQSEDLKHTPSSLGWIPKLELFKLYKFVIPKGQLPYLELLEKWTPTYDTPSRVYLDEPKGYKNNQFPCMYPGMCNAKQNIFRRPADLERHYKNVHADEKDRFPCDYEQCTLLRDPFTRKDHYRDHLRDFHKEDIGAAKSEKSARSDREKQKWQKKQKVWLAERKISHKHWRCAKCLVKNNVSQVGWDCASCKVPCEAHRIEARRRLTLAPGESSGSRSETQANASLDQKVDYSNCSTCNGAACIDDGYGTYVSCPVCQPSAAPFAAYDYDAPYNHDQSVPSTSSTAYAAPTTNSVADMFASLVLGGSLK